MSSSADIPSKARHRVTLQRPEHVPDGAGGVSRTWVNVAYLWAGITFLDADESLANGQFSSRRRYRIVLRYRSDIQPEKRFLWGSKRLAIVQVNEDHKYDGFVEVMALEEPEVA